MPFDSANLRGVPRLERAVRNAPPLRYGEHSDGVVALQGALIDLGFPMPRSINAEGAPDGIYGRETVDQVRAFQRQQGLAIDGSAGRQTLTRLDRVHAGRMGTYRPKPRKARRKPPPAPQGEPHFRIGYQDPVVKHDIGSGRWNSEPASHVNKGLRSIVLSDSFRSATSRYPGPDASRHLTHYMRNSGTALTFDVDRMVRESPQAGYYFDSEAYRAQQFVETLPAGEHLFSARRAHSGNNDPATSPNWFYGVAGYAAWGKGRVFVTEVAGQRTYRLEFFYHVSDRYNFDGDKGFGLGVANWLEPFVVAEGIVDGLDYELEFRDEELSVFHRQGLAREFKMGGSARRAYEWIHGAGMPEPPMYEPPDLP